MLRVWDLGMTGYGESWNLQKRLRCRRLEGRAADLLLLLQHPPTITIGKSGTPDHVLLSREQLAGRGISLFFVDRGGDVTYHGPGQLVGYPILNLKERGIDLHRYVQSLEEVILRTLADFSINADRDESHPGVWIGGEGIAAIGLSVRKWVSMHGFALNVNVDLEHFSFIRPCGLAGRRATSMSRILGGRVPMEEVTHRLISHFCDTFGFPLTEVSSMDPYRLPLNAGKDPFERVSFSIDF